MRTMELEQVEIEFLNLIDEIERTGEVIVITRGGRPAARLEPVISESAEQPPVR